MKLEFFRPIFDKKKIKYQVSSKSGQWKPSCSMRAERETERERERQADGRT
jgi:hypothetical protein